MDEQHNGASGAPTPVYDRYDDWRPVVTLEMIDAWLDATSPFDEGGDEDESPGNGTTSSAHANTKGGKQKRRRKPVKDLDAYLKQHNIAVVSGPESSNPAWSQLYVLEVCPWNADHTNHSACVGQIAESDAWFARCLHDSCAGKGWSEFRDAVEGDGGDDEESGEKKQSAYSRTYEKLESKFFAASDDGAQTGANATRDDLDADEDSDIKHAFTVRFHSPEGETYARVPKGNDTEQHHVTMRIESKAFRQWLQFQALLEHEMLRDNDLRMMQSSYAADALYQGPVHEVHYRLCEYDGAIWHDLLDDAGRAGRIKNGGWKLISDPPTFFIRKKGGLALPTPQSPPLAKGQTAGQYLHKHLRKWLNVLPPQPKRDKDGKPTGETTDFDYVLAVCALVGMLRPNGPHPVINPRGEQGAAKSTFAQVFRRLIDPQKVELEGEPQGTRDMAISAQGCWVLAYDNLPRLGVAQSNVLCRMSTGGGFRTRQLYTDDEEALFSFQRPVILTGIADIVVRSDLLDRTLSIKLSVIPKKSRKADDAFWADFEKERPTLLGVMLTVFAQTLQNLPNVKVKELPRMAAWARFAYALEPVMGWPAGTVKDALAYIEDEATAVAIEGSAIVHALLHFLQQKRGCKAVTTGGFEIDTDRTHAWVGTDKRGWADEGRPVLWRGTAVQLLAELTDSGDILHKHVAGWQNKVPGWPKVVQQLGIAVAALAPYLRQMDIDISQDRRKKTRYYVITDTRKDEQVIEHALEHRM